MSESLTSKQQAYMETAEECRRFPEDAAFKIQRQRIEIENLYESSAEFVRMQHELCQLLGVDAETDSLDLHARIKRQLQAYAVETAPTSNEQLRFLLRLVVGLPAANDEIRQMARDQLARLSVETAPASNERSIREAFRRWARQWTAFANTLHKQSPQGVYLDEKTDLAWNAFRAGWEATSPDETESGQSGTVGEHQSGEALRSPDPANVAGGPRPSEETSEPRGPCPKCGAAIYLGHPHMCAEKASVSPTHQHQEHCPKLSGGDCNCNPTPLLHETLRYPCGCSASGPYPLPTYCPQHSTVKAAAPLCQCQEGECHGPDVAQAYGHLCRAESK